MKNKIYNSLWTLLMVIAAVVLYPKYPLLAGLALALFALAFTLQGIAYLKTRGNR